MLIFRNSSSCIKSKLPILKFPALFLSDSSDKNDNTNVNTNKSLVEKLDNMMKKAEQEIKIRAKDPTPELDDIDESTSFTEVISTSVPKKIIKRTQEIKSRLTPYTMSNLLQPMNLNDLPSRKADSGVSKSFSSLLRHSSLVQLGDFQNKKVIGVVFEVVGKDLYIDFGGKFYCVCKQPDDGDKYVRGSVVMILLKDMELTAAFMLDKVATTILEADGKLLDSVSSVSNEDVKLLYTP